MKFVRTEPRAKWLEAWKGKVNFVPIIPFPHLFTKSLLTPIRCTTSFRSLLLPCSSVFLLWLLSRLALSFSFSFSLWCFFFLCSLSPSSLSTCVLKSFSSKSTSLRSLSRLGSDLDLRSLCFTSSLRLFSRDFLRFSWQIVQSDSLPSFSSRRGYFFSFSLSFRFSFFSHFSLSSSWPFLSFLSFFLLSFFSLVSSCSSFSFDSFFTLCTPFPITSPPEGGNFSLGFVQNKAFFKSGSLALLNKEKKPFSFLVFFWERLSSKSSLLGALSERENTFNPSTKISK